MLYFSEVDSRGHELGPEAPEVDSAIIAMDAVLGRLLDGIQETPVAEAVNVVVVSDHGMAHVPAENVVFLDDYADLEGVRVVYNSTQALLYFDGDETRLFDIYETLRDRLEHATVHFPEELPARWHYGESRRVGELVVVGDEGWMVASREGRPWNGGGMHGWDPAQPAMHGIFLAAGPSVRPGPQLEAFENVHVYPFAAALAGLEPAPGIDGDLAVLAEHLRAPVPAH
ncbi:MAG TPA: alkaline phosphatase family protein, partial [Longimicrobiales bacterium]|nr:alkaline phosphatase family protein [Longimicrobiales bacterium]